MLMFFSGLVFIFIILFFAMRADDVFITEFELNRRVERGDRRAEKLLLKKQLTPSYNFVIKASLVTFSIILVLLISEITEPLRAFFITVGLVAVASLIARSSLVFKISKEIFGYLKPYLLAVYQRLGEKTKRRIIKENKQRSHPVFYSKEELMQIIGSNDQKALSNNEIAWLGLVLRASNGVVSEIMTAKDDLRIIHQMELLGPLIIDEIHKTGQDKFVVTQKDENEIVGVISIEKVSSLDDKTSQIAKNIMEREFMTLEDGQNSLEAFAEMIKSGSDFAIVKRGAEFVGVVRIADFIE